MIDVNGHAKLTDFGMSKILVSPEDYCKTFCGTPNYIAPEIINNKKYSFLVDWWAFGVLCFELMCGFSPFRPIRQCPSESRERALFRGNFVNLISKLFYPALFDLILKINVKII